MPAPRWVGIIGSYLAVAIGILTLLFGEGILKKPENDCPNFDPETYNILLLPFNAIENTGEFKPEVAIGKRLKDFLRDSVKHNQGAAIETFKKPIAYHGYDPSVLNLAHQCSAEMVIWGEFINTPQEKIIYPHFAFTDQAINAAGIIPEEESFTISSLKDIIDGSLVTRNMENWLFRLLSLVIHLAQNTAPGDLLLEADELLAMSADTSSQLIALAVRSKVLYQIGDTLQAENTLHKMIKLQPVNNYALVNLGNIHTQQGNYQQAIDEYSKVIEKNPEKTAVKIKRADVLTKMDRAADAKKELEQIRRENKQVDTAYLNKKIIQNEAIIKAKSNASVSGLTPTQMSTHHLSIGDFDGAQAAAAKALANSPQNDVAKNNYIEAVLSKPEDESLKTQELKAKNISTQDIQRALKANPFLKYKVDSVQMHRIIKQ